MQKPQIRCAQLFDRFPDLLIESVGARDRVFTGVSSPELGVESDAIFMSTPKSLATGLKSPAKVWVVNKKFRETAEQALGDRTLLISHNAELLMARVIHEFLLETPYKSSHVTGIHATAVIAPDATIGNGARIGPYAFIGAKATIGDNVYIGASSVIEDGAEIGNKTVIHPHVFIGHHCKIGQCCEIHPSTVVGKEGFGYAHDAKGNHYRIPHQGIVVFEDDVHVGSTCTFDRGTFGETRIRFGTKIDNRVHIGHNSVIGRNCIITAGFTVAGSTTIGDNFLCGGNTSVTGHITVGDNVQVAALSAIRKTPPGPGSYGGDPLEPIQNYLKTKAAIPHLPKMRRQLDKIMKHLGLTDEAAEKE